MTGVYRMRKVLHYVGHYDYLIYSFLLDSALVDDEVRADFIVQKIQNSARVKEFLEEKSRNASKLVNHFATVDDEFFCRLDSENETLQTIKDTYDKIFEQLGSSIQEYDAIYMSFDEWNSFGIYLECFENLPPVKVVAKFKVDLLQDLYDYTSFDLYFSSLQKKYRVLNAESKHISERIFIWEDAELLKEKYRDFKKFLAELDNEKKQWLFEFFNVTEEDLITEPGVLLITDSFWFRNHENHSYEYSRMYRSFLDLISRKEDAVTVKINSRYEPALIERESILKGAKFIEGYVPSELIAVCNSKVECACSVGNQIPQIIRELSERPFVADGSYINNWREINRLDYLFKLAAEQGYSIEFCDDLARFAEIYCGLSGEKFPSAANVNTEPAKPLNALYRRLSGKKTPRSESANSEPVKPIYVYKEITAADLLSGNLSKNNINAVVCSFVIKEGFAGNRKAETDKLVRIVLNKYSSDDIYAESLYFSANNISQIEEISSFKYSARKTFSKTIIRAAAVRKESYPAERVTDNIYSKEYINAKVKFTSITVVGTGDLAYRFCKTWGDKLDIRCAVNIDGSPVNSELEKIYEIRNGIENINRNDYVIICLPFIHNLDILPEYAVARDNLLRNGFKAFQDFTYYRFFEAADTGKKIMLFCGYCELGGVKQILDLTSANDKYCMIFYHMGRDTNQNAPGYKDFIATVKFCDILLYAPYVINRETIPVDILKLIKSDTKVVKIPQISFRGYAPYKSIRFNERNFELTLFGIVRYPFLYKIPFVNEMINKGMSNEKILSELKRDDLFSKEEIINNYKEALQILKKMDAYSDVPIYDFIEKSFNKSHVFKDCVHANDLVFFEYARRIAAYFHEDLQNEIDALEIKCRENGAYFQVASEEPILPCVAKTLGLTFVSNDKLYMEKVTDEKIRFKTFDEWFTDYCDYFRAVRQVRKTLSPIYRTKKVTIFRNEMIFGEEDD